MKVSFMIRIILFCLLAQLILLCISCENEIGYKKDELKETIYGTRITVFTIDGCEYINYSGSITHKGNCKYCQLKNK